MTFEFYLILYRDMFVLLDEDIMQQSLFRYIVTISTLQSLVITSSARKKNSAMGCNTKLQFWRVQYTKGSAVIGGTSVTVRNNFHRP